MNYNEIEKNKRFSAQFVRLHDTQHNDTWHNDIQHKTANATLCIVTFNVDCHMLSTVMLSVLYAEWH
jgi:hypothetical protein